MTACSSKLQHISYVAEAAWGEASTSATSAQTIPTTVLADVSGLGRAMIESGRVVQYRNEVPKMIPGMFAGSFAIEVELVGLGSTAAGAVTATPFINLIGWALGAVGTPANGTTVANTSTVTSLVTTASGTFAEGQGVRVGTKGDTRGDGQWAVVASHSGTTMALKTALPVAPTSGTPDKIYTSIPAYTVESSCVVDSMRFFIKTADVSWCLHGCFPQAIKINAAKVEVKGLTDAFAHKALVAKNS